ncbi:uncharacterized protein HD556DRAFT_1429137 [Suillus plorans]|uniref:C2H2-type domain-containing protein n=2 Tax=Suillus TaxID=5379 RepID=A0A9P7DWP2_9AGAM|nr:uncharacterized protein HD556DRAFT_1429137 [Suillus plorans]KAG1805024.1 hypothetical protein HD556DRAFT_1429137 [Suillus plorans]
MRANGNLRAHNIHNLGRPQPTLPCLVTGCIRRFYNRSGRTTHMQSQHPLASEEPDIPSSHHSSSESSSRRSQSSRPGTGHAATSSARMHSRSPTQTSAGDEQLEAPGSRDDQMEFDLPEPDGRGTYHPNINGRICDEHGDDIPPNTPPPPRPSNRGPDNWTPYANRVEFEVADFLYRRNQMSGGDIDFIFNLWAASLAAHGETPPFANHVEMYNVIDSTPLGDVAWQSFSSEYNGALPEGDIPTWMTSEYDVWFRDPRILVHNILSNPDFEGEFDYAPLQEYDTSNGAHRFQDFMSAIFHPFSNFLISHNSQDLIAEDPNTIGSMFVPIILGSDKTTVSVATGHNQYWPVYMSISNIRNNVRRAHRNGVVLLGFLAIPTTDKESAKDAHFRKFRRQLLHSSLAKMLESLKPGMTTPEVVRSPDGHFRRAVYGLGPYIADYPEQALLACIVQNWCPKCTAPADGLDNGTYGRRSRDHTEVLVEEFELGVLWDEYGLVGDIVPFTNYFPRADIHELLSPDILHQLIKGAFKDHIVTWVHKYIKARYSENEANIILDDIDHRIALAPSFAGLRRFPEGRGFKQWTGDDSKALMKVYIPAIEGHVPPEMVLTLQALIDFVYIARRNIIDSNSLNALDDALERFHRHREIFETSGVRPNGFNLPRQHSLIHYHKMIRSFGAPNGLCSSITESKHIKAVKEPWRRSSRFEALNQMLLTNQRLDKLAASRIDFASRGMLTGTCLSYILDKLGLNAPVHNAEAIQVRLEDEPIDIPHLGRNNHVNADLEADADQDAELEGDAVAGPTVIAHVDLAKKSAKRIYADLLADQIGEPELTTHIQQFLHDQLHCSDSNSEASESGAGSSSALPELHEKITLYTSAIATFFAPSDVSGIGGMRYERIRAVDTWRNGPGRYDCVFISTDPTVEGMRGFDIAQVRLFFSFKHNGVHYPCAFVHWFKHVHDSPDENTGMWVVEPETREDGTRFASVIHLDCIFRAAHLMPVFGHEFVPTYLSYTQTLDAFRTYYVNKYIDHQAFEIAW